MQLFGHTSLPTGSHHFASDPFAVRVQFALTRNAVQLDAAVNVAAAFSRANPPSLNLKTMRRSECNDECVRRGLSHNGTVPELKKRLTEARQLDKKPQREHAPAINKTASVSDLEDRLRRGSPEAFESYGRFRDSMIKQ